jgi:hypothetical protein
MKTIEMVNLAAHFLLELCGLGALIYWGFQTGEGLMKIVLGMVLPLLAAVAWGTFRVPNDPGKAPVLVSYVRAGDLAVKAMNAIVAPLLTIRLRKRPGGFFRRYEFAKARTTECIKS